MTCVCHRWKTTRPSSGLRSTEGVLQGSLSPDGTGAGVDRHRVDAWSVPIYVGLFAESIYIMYRLNPDWMAKNIWQI